jgi:hypothetical protein
VVGDPLRENSTHGGGKKFGETRKARSPNFLPPNALKSHKTAKQKFGKAWRKPPKICKKFGKSLEKIWSAEALISD